MLLDDLFLPSPNNLRGKGWGHAPWQMEKLTRGREGKPGSKATPAHVNQAEKGATRPPQDPHPPPPAPARRARPVTAARPPPGPPRVSSSPPRSLPLPPPRSAVLPSGGPGAGPHHLRCGLRAAAARYTNERTNERNNKRTNNCLRLRAGAKGQRAGWKRARTIREFKPRDQAAANRIIDPSGS